MEWEMWAFRCEGINEVYYDYVSPHRRMLDFVGLNYPVVQVRVQEESEAQYYGWIAAETEVPIMIQPHVARFNVQFPYSPQEEEKLGRGRIVRLRIDEI